MRLTESMISKAIRESIKDIIREKKYIDEATAGGGGALTGAFLDGSGQSDTSMGVSYPLFGGKVLKQGNNLGDKINKKDNGVDMKSATARHDGKGGSISIPKRRNKNV